MDEIDNLLAQLQIEYAGAKPQVPLPDLDTSKTHPAKSKLAGNIEQILLEVKSDFEKKDIDHKLQQQQELDNRAIAQAQIKAQAWLKTLEPLSTEGIWFEGFAKNYTSKLEAAIDYLQSANQDE